MGDADDRKSPAAERENKGRRKKAKNAGRNWLGRVLASEVGEGAMVTIMTFEPSEDTLPLVSVAQRRCCFYLRLHQASV